MLKLSLLALVVVRSGFMTTASAVRRMIDFPKEQGSACIEASDLRGYVAILNTVADTIKQTIAKNVFTMDLKRRNVEQVQPLFSESKKTGVIHIQDDDRVAEATVVLKNGILGSSEAKKLPEGVKGSICLTCGKILHASDIDEKDF